jgi:hypothetical protein
MWGFFTPEEWKAIKEKLTKASPKLLLILTVLVIGYSFGWYMKGQDVMMDCKYAGAFRHYTDSFTCQRKL